jgi:hypothetical protein
MSALVDAPAIRICTLLLSGQAPEITHHPVGCFEQALSIGMVSKGSVREKAYSGAKPDRARCNGQLDVEARFKNPPGQFKPVDLCRQIYFGEKYLYVHAGF